MHLKNADSTITRLFITLAAVLLITPIWMPTAHADMVIAPSTIVSNANTHINDDNYRNGRDKDTTVKAIIAYPLDSTCLLIQDASDVRFWESAQLEAETGRFVEALSIRYCYIDDNLIVEFDRAEITAYLEELEIKGDIGVVVEGTFRVTCSEVPLGIDNERSEIVLDIKSSRN
ncbi:hypothetical protein [Desulfosarcina alkanivorans]|nr:hypothetical protein [Desulfosarcina alkanivorans]